MGESLSTLTLWEKDPKYEGVKNKQKSFDKDTRNLVDEFLMEQDKFQTERGRLKKQLDKLQSQYSFLNEENLKLRTENDYLKLEIKQYIRKEDQLEMSKSTRHSTNKMFDELLAEKKLNTDIQRQQTEIQTLQKEKEMLMKDNEKLRSDQKNVFREKENALLRLDANRLDTNIQPTDANAELSESSNSNGPARLAEKFC